MIVNDLDDLDGGNLLPVEAPVLLGWTRLMGGFKDDPEFVVHPDGELALPSAMKQRMASGLRELVHLGKVFDMRQLLQSSRSKLGALTLQLLLQQLVIVAELPDLGVVELDFQAVESSLDIDYSPSRQEKQGTQCPFLLTITL